MSSHLHSLADMTKSTLADQDLEHGVISDTHHTQRHRRGSWAAPDSPTFDWLDSGLVGETPAERRRMQYDVVDMGGDHVKSVAERTREQHLSWLKLDHARQTKSSRGTISNPSIAHSKGMSDPSTTPVPETERTPILVLGDNAPAVLEVPIEAISTSAGEDSIVSDIKTSSRSPSGSMMEARGIDSSASEQFPTAATTRSPVPGPPTTLHAMNSVWPLSLLPPLVHCWIDSLTDSRWIKSLNESRWVESLHHLNVASLRPTLTPDTKSLLAAVHRTVCSTYNRLRWPMVGSSTLGFVEDYMLHLRVIDGQLCILYFTILLVGFCMGALLMHRPAAIAGQHIVSSYNFSIDAHAPPIMQSLLRAEHHINLWMLASPTLRSLENSAAAVIHDLDSLIMYDVHIDVHQMVLSMASHHQVMDKVTGYMLDDLSKMGRKFDDNMSLWADDEGALRKNLVEDLVDMGEQQVVLDETYRALEMVLNHTAMVTSNIPARLRTGQVHRRTGPFHRARSPLLDSWVQFLVEDCLDAMELIVARQDRVQQVVVAGMQLLSDDLTPADVYRKARSVFSHVRQD